LGSETHSATNRFDGSYVGFEDIDAEMCASFVYSLVRQAEFSYDEAIPGIPLAELTKEQRDAVQKLEPGRVYSYEWLTADHPNPTAETGELLSRIFAPGQVECQDVAELVEVKMAIHQAVLEMTTWQRIVLVLRLQGYCFTEIARHFHRTEGSPRNAYKRALRHLARHLLKDNDDRNP